MDRAALALLATTVSFNVLLWGSYVHTGARRSDFGAVPRALHTYLLVMAVVAYLATLVYVGLLITDGTREARLVATACVAVYFWLQAYFLPLVRTTQRTRPPPHSPWWVRVHLVACTVPLAVLTVVGARAQRPALVTLGGLATAHALVNDALLYGLLFHP